MALFKLLYGAWCCRHACLFACLAGCCLWRWRIVLSHASTRALVSVFVLMLRLFPCAAAASIVAAVKEGRRVWTNIRKILVST